MKDEKGSKKRGVRSRKVSPFAANLSRLLTSRELTIRQAAAICEVSPSVVSSWLAGGAPQDLLSLQKLCRSLNYDFELLLTGSSAKINPREMKVEDIFDEEASAFSGVFKIEAKRLVPKRK